MNITIDSADFYKHTFKDLKYGNFVVIEGDFETENVPPFSASCEPIMYRDSEVVQNFDHGNSEPIEREICYFKSGENKFYRFAFIVPKGVDKIEVLLKCNQGKLKGNGVCFYVTEKPKKQPSNIKSVAHLGYTGYAPRNTLSAFELAGIAGFCECVLNINRTKDGKLVCLHNNTIDESSTGSGLIGEMTYDEAKKYDFGVRYNPFYKGEKLPLADEAFAILKKYSVAPVLRLNHETTVNDAEILYKLLNKNNIEKFTVKAFRENALKNFYEVAGDSARYGYCINREFKERLNFMKNFSAKDKYIDMLYTDITEQKVKEVFEAKLPLEAWIVNGYSDIINLSRLGVSGFTTDIFQFDNYIF